MPWERFGAFALALALALAAGAWIGARTRAAGPPAAAPGSVADPLVSQSYVTKAVDGVLAEAGGRERILTAGETFTLGAGTTFVLLGGSALVSAGQPSHAVSGTSAAPVPLPLVDLSTGRAIATTGSSAVAVPLAHLILCGVGGTAVTAGSGGAVLWLEGAEAVASGPAAGG